MQPSNKKNPFRRAGFIIAGVVCFGASLLSARAQGLELQVEEAGQSRAIELATDEIEVARTGAQPGGRLRQTIEAKVAGASVMEDSPTRVLVKLPGAYNRSLAALRSERIDLAVPDAESSPVFYIKGTPRDKWSRRLGTKSVLVYLNPGQTPEEVRQAAGAASVREPGIEGVVVLKFLTAFHAVEATKRLTALGLQHHPLLRQFMQGMAAPPKDQFFSEQWHLVNTGQHNGVAGIDINVLPVWDFGLGNGTTIAIVDTGVQTLHPDLTANCPPVATKLHHDFNDDDDDPKPLGDAINGHGTCVAGLAAARQNNGSPDSINGSLLGVSGVAPEARLLGLRLIAAAFSDEEAAAALTWAPNNNIVHVSNNSWGVPDVFGLGGFDLLAKAAQRDAAVKGREGRGQVTVFSAGNGRFNQGNANYSSVANSRYVLTVGALDSTGKFSSYSTPGAPLLVTAPGGGLGFVGADQRCVTTDVTGIGGFNPAAGDLANTDYTRTMNGTSAAAPNTSGVAALMIEANPNLTWRDVKEIMAGTARRINESATDWIIRPTETGEARLYNGGGFKFNHDYGAGLVDALGAVVRAKTWRNLGPELSQGIPRKESGTGANIPDDGFTPLVREFDFNGVSFPNLRLEQIEIEVLITHRHRSDLDIAVISPSGVRSRLAETHFAPALDSDVDYRDIVFDFRTDLLIPRKGGWVFTSTHHWGENSTGKWRIEITDRFGGNTQGKLVSSAIRLYGTAAGSQRVMFDRQLYSLNEPAEVLLGGTYSQTGNIITVQAAGHNLAPGNTVHLDFTTGSPDAPADATFTVVTSTAAPGTTFTVTAPDSVSRLGNVVIRSGTYSQTGNEITITANGHRVAVGNTVRLDFTSGTPSSATSAVYTVVTSTPGTTFTVAAADSTARSGNVSITPAAFQTLTLRRLGPTTEGFTVGYQTTLGTATEGKDFVFSSGTATFVDGQATADIQIPILGDSDPEVTESAQVVLNNLQGSQVAFGGITLARINIVDDEVNRVKVEATDAVASERTSEVTPDPGVFTITRSKVTAQPLDVFFTLGGTAQPGTGPDGDYNPLPNSGGVYAATIPAFETSVTVTIEPREDTAIEGTENVVLVLRPSLGYELGVPASAEVIIIDNDRPKVQITLLDNLAAETRATPPPDTARFLIKRSVVSNKSLIVFLNYGGTQILGANYLLTYRGPDGVLRTLSDPLVSNTVEIGPNQTEVEVTLTSINDDIYQATKSIDVSIQPRPDYDFNFGFLTSVHLNITEDDPFPDTNVPVAKIKSPKASPDIDAPNSLRFFGRATDNVSVVRVLYRLNGGDWLIVPITPGPSVTWDFPIEYFVQQGTVTKGKSTITGLADTSKIAAGMPLQAAGIPSGAIVTSKTANSATVDKLATATATTEVRISYLALGGNTIEAQAIDDDGNVSKLASEFFNYVQLRALTVNVNGPGRVTNGFAPSSPREAGKTVTLKATAISTADNVSVFSGWTGYVTWSQRTLSFVMPNTEVTLTANFIPSPFVPQVAGIYSGLIRATPASAFAFETSGYLNVTVTPTGAFSGRLILAGVKYPLLGEFSGTGQFVGQLNRVNDFPLALNLKIDIDPNGKQQITGTVSSNTFALNVVANRAAYSKTSPAPGVGNYTLILPQAIPIADAQRDPRGNGIGTLSIKPNGKVHWEGTLPDGTKVIQDERLAKDNTWPLFLRLYQKKGVLLGLVTVDSAQAHSDLSGGFDWFKPVTDKDVYFPLGFRILDADIIGSFYGPPAPGTRALGGFTDVANNGRATLQEGSMLADIVRTFTYDPKNRVTISNPGVDGLEITIDETTGLISGSFIHPVSGQPTPIEGVLFLKQQIGVGRFQGSSVSGVNPQTGRFLFEAAP